MSTEPAAAQGAPFGLAISPSGSNLYVSGQNFISDYSLASPGSPNLISNSLPGPNTYPYSLAITPAGNFLYAADLAYPSGGQILAYSVSSVNGSLTQITGVTNGLNYPLDIRVHPSGKFAYVANSGATTGVGTGNVSEYAISANGSLSLIGGINAGQNPYVIAVHPNGNFVYVLSYPNSIFQYAVNLDGTLSPLSPSSVASSPLFFPPAGGNVGLVIDGTGSFLYAAGGPSTPVTQFSIGANGLLTPMNPPAVSNTNNSGPIVVVP